MLLLEKISPSLTDWIERRPQYGMLASITGFGTALLSWMNVASSIIGFVGAVLGLIAGYYTLRIKLSHWHTIQKHIKHHNQVPNPHEKI